MEDLAQAAALMESDFIALVVFQAGDIVWANPAMHRLLGYSNGELIGQPTHRLYSDQESCEAFSRLVSETLERGGVYGGIIPQRRKDGSTGWFEFHLSRQAGNPQRVIAAVVDRSTSHGLSLLGQEGEARYRAVLSDQTELISRVLPDGTFIFVNDVYCRVFGKRADELIGQRWHPVAHPDDIAMIEAKLQTLAPWNPIVTIENRVYVAGGEMQWMQFVNRGFFGTDGRLNEIQSVGRDITRLKITELALRRSEAALERAQKVAQVGSFELDGDTEHFTHSAETARLFDLKDAHESSFSEWFGRVHPEDQVAVEVAWRAALQGAPYDMTYRIVVRGEVLWIRARAELTFDARGNVLTCVGTVQNITAQEHIESRLRESQARLEMVLAASGLGWWDAIGPTGGVTVDQRISDMLGFPIDELSRTDALMRLIDPRDLDRFKGILKDHLQGDSETFSSEHRMRHRDGHWVSVEARGKVIERDESGEAIRMVGTLLDITQRKRLHDEGVDLLKRIESLIRESASGQRASRADANALAGLTRREIQVLGLIAEGLSSLEIANQLNLSINTVSTHRQNLMGKLDLHTAADVTRFALDHGVLKRS